MRSITGMRLCLGSAGLTAALLFGGCATMEPRAERWVAPPLGSTFTEGNHNTGSFGSGDSKATYTRGERTWQDKRVMTFETPQGMILSTPEGGWLGFLGAGDKVMVRWEPPLGMDFPLTVGKTWTKSFKQIDAGGRAMPFDVTCKVQAYEDTTVPSGTFKTFRVACSNTMGEDYTVWFSPELGVHAKQSRKRSATYPLGAGTREMELIAQTIKK
jgi:hypothetical protein